MHGLPDVYWIGMLLVVAAHLRMCSGGSATLLDMLLPCDRIAVDQMTKTYCTSFTTVQ